MSFKFPEVDLEKISRAENLKHHIASQYGVHGEQKAEESRQGGGDLPNFGELFDEALTKVKERDPSVDDFVAKFNTRKFVDEVDYDPTKSKYFTDFQAKDHFRLNEQELHLFRRNGFVVSERLGVNSFAEAYYRTYSDHLPVYVSADSILHAWHRSFDQILQELEEKVLFHCLSGILSGMTDRIVEISQRVGSESVLTASVEDCDFFLAVALSLLSGEIAKAQIPAVQIRVVKALEAVKKEEMMEFELFGKNRKMDFSQFKVRGHYEKSEALKKYFKAMMWLGRIDMRISGGTKEPSESEGPSSARELGSAVVMLNLMDEESFKNWERFDNICQTFVGVTDSMTFSQLRAVIERADTSLDSLKTLDDLTALQEKVDESSYGRQNINSGLYETAASADVPQFNLPRSFTFLGQKFVMDSWALGQLCFDKIMYRGNKVARRIPSSLDVAFSVLKNDSTIGDLHRRMTTKGVAHRDGFAYHQNLEAVRETIDGLDDQEWSKSIYTMWLRVLCTLSQDPVHNSSSLHTTAWAKKELSTQLGSWTELRHDTILYTKQGYGMMTLCDYPEGFVEPRPDFWDAMSAMARASALLLQITEVPEVNIPPEDPRGWDRRGTTTNGFMDRCSKFFRGFAEKTEILARISKKQVAQERLDQNEVHFLKTVMEARYGSGGSRYLGWYPKLFFRDVEDSGRWDPLVADVFTNPPSAEHGDPGSVLHQGVGNVFNCLLSVKNGDDIGIYSGPVFGYYEFSTPNAKRLSDSDWRNILKSGETPSLPEWSREYLVPGKNADASRYHHEDDTARQRRRF